MAGVDHGYFVAIDQSRGRLFRQNQDAESGVVSGYFVWDDGSGLRQRT